VLPESWEKAIPATVAAVRAFLFKAGSHLRARRAVDPLVGDAAAAFPMLVIKMIADCGVISTGFELPANRCELSPLTGMISVPGRRWL
jgi:hypothetical protein